MSEFTATYSPDDNKLRLYAATRLPADLYARVRGAGFIWAPKQDCFVAPMWTPEREDICIELAGEIDDEDKSLCDRAEERAERFEGYSDNRAADAQRAKEAVSRIADGIPMGQPIMVGHHSEKHARRDAEKIRSGMTRAVKMWETSNYWTARAAGALRHAKYKEQPEVRARRIKGLESEQRKVEKSLKGSELIARLWGRMSDPTLVTRQDGQPMTDHDRAVALARRGVGPYGIYSDLTDGKIDATEAQRLALASAARTAASAQRWTTHLANRLAYERAMLEEQGATELLAKKPRPAQLPLCNYRAPEGIDCPNMYRRSEMEHYAQAEMTQAEYASINRDYKGTRIIDNSHRVRTALVKRNLVCVFLTDAKVHARPAAIEPKPREIAPQLAREYKPAPARTEFDDMRDSLKAGVTVVAAPQLFPTPPELAARMIEEARIERGHRVLEPSAGTGRLLEAARAAGAVTTGVEINFDLVQRLRHNFDDIRQADFLSCNGDLGTFDRIVMNPPFADGQDVAHVEHALHMLKPDGRLVAVMSAGVTFRSDKRTKAFRERIEAMGGTIEPLPDDTFKQAGTGVRTVLVVVDA